MLLGDAQPYFIQFRKSLERIDKSLCSGNPTTPATISGGTGSVPAGFDFVTITATANSVLTFADASTYALASGESLPLKAPNGTTIPAITVTSGTVKWIGSK